MPLPRPSGPTFDDVYREWRGELGPSSVKAVDETKLTMSAQAMPLGLFCRWVADKANVSIVVEEKLEARPVTLDVQGVPVSEVLGMVARRLGSQVTRVGRLYFVGSLRPEDRGVLVRKVSRLSQTDLTQALGILLSEHGRSQAYADGLVIVGDRVEVLQRVEEMLDRVEAAPSTTWVIQLYVVSLSDSDTLDLGLDVMPALDVAATVASISNGAIPQTPVVSSKMQGGLELLLKASRERSSVQLLGEPLFLVRDGQKAKVGSGERVPVPRRTVSDQGTVTTNGYDFIDTGVQVAVELREVGHDRASLSVDLNLSEIKSYVESVPVTKSDVVSTSAVVSSSGVYLVGGLRRQTAQRTQSGPFTLGHRDGEVGQVLQVWARVYRIAGEAGAATSGAVERSDGAAPQIETEVLSVP